MSEFFVLLVCVLVVSLPGSSCRTLLCLNLNRFCINAVFGSCVWKTVLKMLLVLLLLLLLSFFQDLQDLQEARGVSNKKKM